MRTVVALTERLHTLHQRTSETPLFNPVFQLSLELSRLLESDELSLEECDGLIGELEKDALEYRANRLRHLVGPVLPSENLAALDSILRTQEFADFRELWSRPRFNVVFTAHPTFMLSPAQAASVANSALGPLDQAHETALPAARHEISLESEHAEAMAAIRNAQDARDAIAARILRSAQTRWPDRWLELTPDPVGFATWVGYDMDGRTDIAWAKSLQFRLAEKSERLDRYCQSLAAIDPSHELLRELRSASESSAAHARAFAGDLAEAADLSLAANRLTAADPARILSLSRMIDQLEGEARDAVPERAVALKALAAAMRADGLGMGTIHFRVNAKQLHNAIRRVLDPDGELDLGSKGAVVRLREAIESVKPVASNFGALAIEGSTAIRQFLTIAQIIRHIDEDAPIRMLIAECEQPATVLAALYFAKLFGVADGIDISPLFETERALEHGGRFLDALLAEKQYREYVRQRGRLAIQTGFSDAGRFVGQVPASLAIERLQGRLADAMRSTGLADVTAVVFNTHGESMGRGAHPSSFRDRLTWPLSPWARDRFRKAGIRLEAEISFQGGDGYLFFARQELALATLTRILESSPGLESPDVCSDPFYRRTELSLDFYRAIRDHQRQHVESRTYGRAITAFGLGLLDVSGSRVSRRQLDLVSDRESGLRAIRAIPHNAILQQLGYPLNVIAGVGSAADGSYEEIAALLTESNRGRQLVRLIRAAQSVASIKTVAAYGELFNSAYWASRPYRGMERHLSGPCEALAEYLIKDDRTGVFRRLASRLRVDALKLHQLLAIVPDDGDPTDREEVRRAIGVCQAIRLALMQHMFIRAMSIPAFSRANDVSREDVVEMVLSLRIDEALVQLRRAFPASFPKLDDFSLDEPTEYPIGLEEGYESVRRNYIDPLEQANALSLKITVVIACYFGAYG